MRVMLGDGMTLFREGLARLLTEAGFEVTGQTGDAEHLLRLVRGGLPDVAVVDGQMAPTYTREGLDAARRLRAEHPGLGVLVLSQHADVDYAMAFVNDADRTAGGAGYLLKHRITDLAELVGAIRRVGAGGRAVDPALAGRLAARRRQRTVLDHLTAREREVLTLMAEGRSNSAIAKRLRLSAKTVEAHVRNVFDRLDLTVAEDDNRRVLAVLAFLRA
ncbi:putative two-component system response regulator, LuxR family protein [Microtetraspora sp. NBRC 13810]|uniref:response regulator transcription factor n=1 Tax=Microtetraspora sp. NBRC 13810 TaxID=3030990 RepID=UPI0024A189A3|nr:response regulator transcription factor [Microtetraspora sp. NBRC 13810]GLW09128.1 putative two-component system response regulator, LuxR family protein [Microtetraspora sp. NBRC 13810]